MVESKESLKFIMKWAIAGVSEYSTDFDKDFKELNKHRTIVLRAIKK